MKKLNRRDFIKYGSGTVAAGAVTLGAPNIALGSTKKVVVVGGGAGGAIAAKYIKRADEAMTDRLDELLWVFRDQSFIPHQREEDAAQPCAVIVNHTTPPKHREIMINLSLDVSPDYADYDRLIEVVSAVNEIKQAGRERFRHYSQQSYQPKHHAVS